MADAAFMIAPGHPALDGHFPGNPVVPGVLVLEHVQQALEARIGPVTLTGMPQVKFVSPLRPGETCSVVFTEIAAAHARFDCRCDERTIARGTLQFDVHASDAR
jgi:3-hydroxyacyl-[acyl-carrier-protein] dehydratase